MYFKRIRELREERGKTQKQIADLLYYHVDVYRRYENGDRDVPSSMLIALAKYYDVSVSYIVGLTDSPKR